MHVLRTVLSPVLPNISIARGLVSSTASQGESAIDCGILCGRMTEPTPVLRQHGMPYCPPPAMTTSSAAPQAAAAAAQPLIGKEDRYGGLVLDDPAALPDTPLDMAAALALSLPAWRERGLQGIWLKVPVSRAALIAPAIEAGFQPHHAEVVSASCRGFAAAAARCVTSMTTAANPRHM